MLVWDSWVIFADVFCVVWHQGQRVDYRARSANNRPLMGDVLGSGERLEVDWLLEMMVVVQHMTERRQVDLQRQLRLHGRILARLLVLLVDGGQVRRGRISVLDVLQPHLEPQLQVLDALEIVVVDFLYHRLKLGQSV